MQGSSGRRGPCEWCQGSGLITAYHPDYRGDQTVYVEDMDRHGEIHTRRMPGSVAVHCDCALGEWMRARVEPDQRCRIPTLPDVINGRVPYILERPDLEDDGELTDEARAFIRRWKDGFGGRPLPGVPRVVRHEPEDVGRALHERSERLKAAGGAA